MNTCVHFGGGSVTFCPEYFTPIPLSYPCYRKQPSITGVAASISL